MSNPDCTVLIRAFNEGKHIGKLLEGIRRQTMQNVQVILVDSGSTDKTLHIAESYGVEIYHIQQRDFSFGRSINMGFEHARAGKVVLASAHVYPVYPDWLEQITAPLADTQTALCYGKQRGSPTTKFSENQLMARWYPEQSNLQQSHPFSNNANAAIQRALWEQHPYNEKLPGLEDLEWANWAFREGYKIAYSAEAEIIHIHDETWKQVYNRYRREGMAFKQIFPHENFKLTEVVRLWLRNVQSDLNAAGKTGGLLREMPGILAFRSNQFWGTYQGYRSKSNLTAMLKQTFYDPLKDPEIEEITPHRQIEPIDYN